MSLKISSSSASCGHRVKGTNVDMMLHQVRSLSIFQCAEGRADFGSSDFLPGLGVLKRGSRYCFVSQAVDCGCKDEGDSLARPMPARWGSRS